MLLILLLLDLFALLGVIWEGREGDAKGNHF